MIKHFLVVLSLVLGSLSSSVWAWTSWQGQITRLDIGSGVHPNPYYSDLRITVYAPGAKAAGCITDWFSIELMPEKRKDAALKLLLHAKEHGNTVRIDGVGFCGNATLVEEVGTVRLMN